MGSHVSTQSRTQGSAMNMISFDHKVEKPVSSESCIKPSPMNATGRLESYNSFSSAKMNSGSREEAFFDSQQWIESDCDDDFYSVNGDFTPSRGSTPALFFSPRTSWRSNSLSDNKLPTSSRGSTPARFFSPRTSWSSNSLTDNRLPTSNLAPAPPKMRKKLVELFRESIREERGDIDERGGLSSASTPYASVRSSEGSANGDVVMENEEPTKTRQSCFPRMVSCRNFSFKKGKMCPTIQENGKS